VRRCARMSDCIINDDLLFTGKNTLMNTLGRCFFPLLLSLISLTSPSFSQTKDAPIEGTLYANKQAKFLKGCGDGLDEHSACGDCVRIGIAVTKNATCGHICVKLPDGKTAKDMVLIGKAAEDQTPPGFRNCGQPGNCEIGWARFEGVEYYQDTNQLCGRFKNWSVM